MSTADDRNFREGACPFASEGQFNQAAQSKEAPETAESAALLPTGSAASASSLLPLWIACSTTARRRHGRPLLLQSARGAAVIGTMTLSYADQIAADTA
jgi:hypothetical protein